MSKLLHDVVVTQEDGGWVAKPGSSLLFSGTGCSPCEAIGAMVIANREAIGLDYCIVDGDQFRVSTYYNKSSVAEDLGPNQQKARTAWLKQ